MIWLDAAGWSATLVVLLGRLRLAMSLSFRGARDVVQKPVPNGGRTLERVVRKVLRKERHALT